MSPLPSLLAFVLVVLWFLGVGGVVCACLRTPSVDWLLAPVIGAAVTGLLATWAFTYGAPLRIVASALSLTAAGGLVIGVLAALRSVRRQQGGQSLLPADRQQWWAGISVTTLTGALLVLPSLVGGRQFTVFQGNQWDHFNYVTGALVFARQGRADIAQAWIEPDLVLSDPLLAQARMAIATRPTVFLMYAVSGLGLRIPFADGAAVWLAALGLLLLLALVLLVRTLFPQAGPWWAWGSAAAIVVGFWGQYILDINAWSQQAAMGIIVALVAIAVRIGRTAPPSQEAGRRRAGLGILMGILAAGLFSLYPEVVGITGLLVLASLIPIGWRAKSLGWLRGLWPLGLATLIAAALVVLDWRSTVGFLIGQVGFAVSGQEVYWQFFDAYLLGRDQWYLTVLSDLVTPTGVPVTPGEGLGLLLDRLSPPEVLRYGAGTLVSGAVGVLGMSFLTPPQWQGPAGLLGLVVLSVVGAAAVTVLIQAARRGGLGSRILIAVIAAGLIPVIGLASLGQLFAAGKALAVLSPFISLGLLSPLLDRRLGRSGWLVGIAVMWLVLQVAFALTRIPGAASADGIHRPAPYPSIQRPELKSTINWRDDSALRAASGCVGVEVDIDDVWLRHYAIVRLSEAGVPYRTVQPVVADYGVGMDFGVMPPLPGATCELTAPPGPDGTRRLLLIADP